MKNKLLLKISSLVITAALLCSCGNSGKPESSGTSAQTTGSSSADSQASISTNAAATTTEEPDPDDLSDEEKHRFIIDKAMVQTGDTSRLLKAFEKAEKGEEITVAYIGGSITEGYTVQPEECWAFLTHKWLCEKFPGAQINYVNAGMSGTPSTLGLIRCERDVLAPHGDPDIVFVEFAVNDAQDDLSMEAYECLVRRLYELPDDPAVILMFMRTDNGYSCQEKQSQVGINRGLPMISLNDGLTWAIDNDVMTWADYSNDGAHPNPEGCKLITEMVVNMFESALSGRVYGSDLWKNISSVNICEDRFINMHLLDSTSLTPVSQGEYNEKKMLETFPNGWMRKKAANEGIRFEMTFDSLFIVYHCNKIKSFGAADIYVDGEKVKTINSQAADGWSNPVPKPVVIGDGTAKQHTVEIKMQEGQEDKYFGILAFGITD